MRKILAVGVAALLGACSSSSDKPRTVQWGAQQPPTTAEENAVADSLLTLQANLSYQQASDPQSGMAGFGEQLVDSLASAAASAPAVSTKLARDGVRSAVSGICGAPTVQGDVTTYAWTGCQMDDGSTGITIYMTMDGWLTWNSVLGETRWQIDGTDSMTMPMGDATIQTDGTFLLTGTQTVTASTIVANTSSASQAHTVYQTPQGTFAEDSDATTTLEANLQYSYDPNASPAFCLTGGTLKVVAEQRPTPPAFQGFQLTFGPACNEFLIAKGF